MWTCVWITICKLVEVSKYPCINESQTLLSNTDVATITPLELVIGNEKSCLKIVITLYTFKYILKAKMSVMVSTHQSCACIGYKRDRKGTIIPSVHFEICYIISLFDHTI